MPPSAPPPSNSALRHSKTLLTVAGHDPSSGAGITADLQTFAAHGLFGTSAITALTVQSTLGVAEVQTMDANLLARTLAHLCADLPPAGIKIGMLGSSDIVRAVAAFLQQGITADSAKRVRSAPTLVVLDPILRASSGASLLDPAAIETLHTHLLPVVTWITPNWLELSALTGYKIHTLAEAEAATHILAVRHPHIHIVATGGDQTQPNDLLRLPTGELRHFTGDHIATTSTHGTGCAFSSALLCRLVLGDAPDAAVHAAKQYVTEALHFAPGIGHGKGPLDLLWPLH